MKEKEKKRREIYYFLKCLIKKSLLFKKIEVTEKPDFIIDIEDKRIGVELSEYHLDGKDMIIPQEKALRARIEKQQKAEVGPVTNIGVSEEKLVNIVIDKNEKINEYQKCDDYWLVIYASGESASNIVLHPCFCEKLNRFDRLKSAIEKSKYSEHNFYNAEENMLYSYCSEWIEI